VINAQGEIIAVHTSWIGGEYSKYTIGVAINSAKQIIPYGVLPSGPSPVQPAVTPSVHAGPIRVPEDYATIQAAVQAAGEGGEIQISSGTYQGDITITKPVFIEGETGALLAGAVKIRGVQNVSLRDFKIQGGVEIHDSSSVLLDGLTIQQSLATGIAIEGSWIQSSLTLRGTGKQPADSCLESRSSYTLHIGGVAEVRIENLKISGVLSVTDSAVVTVRGCLFSSNKEYDSGVHSNRESRLTLMNCIVDGTSGFSVGGSAVVTLEKCTVSDSRGSGVSVRDSAVVSLIDTTVGGSLFTQEHPYNAAIYLQGSANVSIHGGMITDGVNANGIRADGQARVTVVDSTISDNGQDGIRAGKQAQVTAVGSTISNNRHNGIIVTDSAMVDVKDTTISRNGVVEPGQRGSGIVGTDSAKVSVKGCSVSENGSYGVTVKCLSLELENSTVADSPCGVSITGEITATITSCIMTGNTDGVSVTAGSVTIVHSELSDNERYGLRIYHASWRKESLLNVDVAGCVIRENLQAGVSFEGSSYKSNAVINMRDTQVVDNMEYGIYFSDFCKVLYSIGNTFNGNGADLGGFAPASLRQALAQPTTKTMVSFPGDYDTLQEALDAVSPGGTVVVGSGNHIGNVTIWKPVAIQGAAGADVTISSLPKRKVVISILGQVEWVKLSGIGIRGSQEHGLVTYGQMLDLDGCIVFNNEGSGINIARSVQRVEVRDCVFRDNTEYGISISSSNTQVEGGDNEMYGNGFPIGGSIQGSELALLLHTLRKSLAAETEQTEVFVPRDYSTLEKAIDATPPGGRISIAAGTFTGVLVILKPVEIVGAGLEKTVLETTPASSAVVWIGPDVEGVKLEGLTIRGGRTGGAIIHGRQVELERVRITYAQRGLNIVGSAQVNLIDCIIAGAGYGVAASDSAQITLQGCIISENRLFGINLEDTAQAQITDCTISENEWSGIHLEDTAQAQIIDCTISENEVSGINLEDTAQAQITGCTISENRYTGIYISGYAQGWVTQCGFSGNWKDGFFIKDSSSVTISDTRVYGNYGHGIQIEDSPLVTMERNAITANKLWGVAVVQGPAFFSGGVIGKGPRFTGQISGNSNVIPSRFEPDGNGLGAISEPWMEFWPDGLISARQPGQGLEPTGCALWVEPGHSIQNTIDSAPEGAVVCLAPGVWRENLVIKKSLMLRGSGDETTAIYCVDYDKPVITIAPPKEGTPTSVSISGVTLVGWCDDGIAVSRLAQVAVHECIIAGATPGIRLADSSEVSVTRCGLFNNTTGIQLLDQAQANITNCTIADGYYGLHLRDSAQASIERTSIISCKRLGIVLYGWPCSETWRTFTGQVVGSRNVVPGPSEPGGNWKSGFCPPYPGDPWPEGFLEE